MRNTTSIYKVKIYNILCRACSVLLSFGLLFSLALTAGCSNNDVDWVTGKTYPAGSTTTASPTQPTTSAAQPSEPIVGEYPSPKFKTGKYIMTTATTTSFDYLTGSGAAEYTSAMVIKYVYALDVTVTDSGLTCVITFDNISLSSNDNGTSTVLFDTAKKDYLSSDTELYYNIINEKFTVTADKSNRITGISGVSQIIAKHPGSQALLDEENLKGVAESVFYPLPSVFTDGTSWQLEQYGLTNVYRLMRISRDKFEIAVNGPEQSPSSFTDEDGNVISYDYISPMSGSLYIDRSDRGIQEITSIQRSNGALTNSGGSVPFIYTVTAITSLAVK